MHSSPFEISPRHFQRSYLCDVSRRSNQELSVEERPPEYDTLSLHPHNYHDHTASTWVESGLDSTLEISENTEPKERDEVFREV